MLEIRSDTSKLARNAFVLVMVVAVSESVIMFLLSSEDIMAVYVMSLTFLLIVLPLTILLALPQTIVVDTASGTVETYILKKRVSQFKIKDIREMKYSSGDKGYCVTTIRKRGDDIPFSVDSAFFKEEEVRMLFDTLAPYSEEYGFEVSEDTEDIPVKGSAATSSGDEAPYKIK